MTENWASSQKKSVTTGIENLPTPIIKHMKRSLKGRPELDGVYHVTELLYCLRKAYYSRISPPEDMSVSSLWNIYRGSTFDGLWSPLFDVNQKNYILSRTNQEGQKITITGTLDFVWIDESNLELVLYDLKMPGSVYYKKTSGAGKFYTEQTQTYLGMAHELGELKNVHRCRVMMLAEDLVIEDIPERDKILDYVFDRGFLLDKALREHDPRILNGPEEKWECDERYCPGDVEWRLNCKSFPKTS